ncbi:MAG: DUF72 domain-containing protein [Spirochaetia bacterium]|jgi:uncharacterized protein YecE (DUF72 family)|nr:DUF72 domain-containing protein [Spirochaetia bacterium]
MRNLRIGTCSWKYPSWENLIYSSREPTNYLAEYAQKYSTVEVDQWFWSLGKAGAALPRRETVEEYDAATPSDFQFTVKCPNAITLSHHRGKKGEPLAENPRFLDADFFNSFIESLAALIPKIGLFIFQFEYLNKDKMASKAQLFDKLSSFMDSLPADFPYAFEIRNPRWMDAEWFSLLKEKQAAPVLLQGYWMDDVARTIGTYGSLIGNSFCIRLHGEDREGMEEKTGSDWSKIVRPKDEELGRIVPAIKLLIEDNRKGFININNHYEGSAPRTIDKILSHL